MNANDPLSQLRDIIEPAAPGLWPLATGWWICILATLLVIALIAWLLRKLNKPARKAGLALVATIFNQYASHQDKRQLLIDTSACLRRLARVRFPESVAMSGDHWQQFLNKTGNTNAFTTKQFEDVFASPYQFVEPEHVDPEFLRYTLTEWIKENL